MTWESLAQMERAVSAWLQGPVARQAWVRRLALFVAHSGDGWFWFPGLLAVMGLAPGLRVWAWTSFKALFVVALVVATLKYTIRRPRPQSPWGGIYRRTDPHSFPSGHAARGAALAVVAWAALPAVWAWAFTLWAGALAWSRAAIGVHHPSDVAAGVLLGALLALLVLTL